jgi:hypothetical protein
MLGCSDFANRAVFPLKRFQNWSSPPMFFSPGLKALCIGTPTRLLRRASGQALKGRSFTDAWDTGTVEPLASIAFDSLFDFVPIKPKRHLAREFARW